MKKFITIAVSALMVASLAGCNKTTSDNKPNSSKGVDIGIVLPTKDEPRWVQDETRFKEAIGTDYSVEILFSQGSSAKEKENVDALLAKGIKVLIICPQDGGAAAAAAEAAKKDGVKVISYDRLITNTDAVDYYVTFDSVAVGEAQAQYLIDKAGTTKGNSLFLYAGAASDNNAFLFFEGAWNKLQPKIADGTFVIKNSSEAVTLKDKAKLERAEMSKIVAQVTTNWDFNEAKNKAESHLTAASAADKANAFILAPNDGTARAIADAFKADSAVKSYVVTGQDAEKASIQYIIDGKQSMTVFKDVRTLVKDSIGMAKDILSEKTPATTGSYNNGKVDVKAKQTQVIVVDQANVKKELVDSGYYQATDFTGLK